MSQIICCCLCGIEIAVDGHPDNPLIWQRYFHTVYTHATTIDAQARVYLSTSSHNRDNIYPDPTDVLSQDNTPLSYQFHRPLPSGNDPDALGYPFHSTCWKLLTAFRPITQHDLQSLFTLARSMPSHESGLDWGHNHGGTTRRIFGSPPGEEGDLCFTFVKAVDGDPADLSEFRDIFEKHRLDDSHSQYSSHQKTRIGGYTPTDPFAKLPNDILFSVLHYLTLEDVTPLQQSSRAFAQLPLPSSFWRGMFQRGGRFESVIEARDYSKVHWESVCRDIHAVMRKGPSDFQIAFFYRSHIWKTCYILHQGLQVMRDGGPCLGTAVRTEFEPFVAQDQDHWLTVSRALEEPGNLANPLFHGCRVLRDRVLTLPAEISHIQFFTVEIFGTRYVSGLKVVSQDQDSSSIGFQRPTSHKIVVGKQRIFGFDLALGRRGVRGIRLVYDDGSSSEWIGDHEDIPKRKLRCGVSGNTVTRLKCGFDAVKLVALSVNVPTRSERSVISDQLYDELEWPTLCHPDLPGPNLIMERIGDRAPPVLNHVHDRRDLPKCFALFLNEQPGALTKIGVRYRYKTDRTRLQVDCLVMAFGETTIELGSPFEKRIVHDFELRANMLAGHNLENNVHEKPFMIDRPGGERIVKLRVWYYGPFMVGLTLETNYSRQVTVSSHETIGGGCRVIDFEAGNHTIVGFWATMTSQMGFGELRPVFR